MMRANYQHPYSNQACSSISLSFSDTATLFATKSRQTFAAISSDLLANHLIVWMISSDFSQARHRHESTMPALKNIKGMRRWDITILSSLDVLGIWYQ